MCGSNGSCVRALADYSGEGSLVREKGRNTLSFRKKVVFSAVTSLFVLVLAEAGLGLLGFAPSDQIDDPFVGFRSKSPLFVSTESDGILETSPAKQVWFNYQRFASPKKAGTKRIFCLGGSTTYGRPFDDQTAFSGWLREMLPVVESTTQWEVINAGGVSYASYRVASVMEELCQYEPDLFVVLTGHNEFLERRTYAGLMQDGWNEDLVFAQTRSILQSSRVFNLLERLARPKNHFMIKDREQLPEEVDEILNHSAGPKDYQRDEQWGKNVLLHFRVNLERMREMARHAGAEIMFVSPASNLRDCIPFKSVSELQGEPSESDRPITSRGDRDHVEFLERSELRRVFDIEDKGKLLGKIEQQLSSDPRNADLLFYRGRCLFELGQYEQARESFLLALDEDVCPLRATSKMATVMQQVAERHSIPLIDFDDVLGRISEQEYGHRCFGDEYFLDHVHPTIETHGLIASEIIQRLRQMGWFSNSKLSTLKLGASELSDVTGRILSRVDREQQAIAFRNLAKVLHWAGKFEEAIPKAVNATQLIEDDLESWFVMADCFRQLGRDDDAYLIYQQIFKIGDYSRAYLPFGELLLDRAEYERAIEFLVLATIVPNPSHRVRAFYDLGLAYLQLGRFQLALESLLECEKLASDEPSTIALIGEAYRSLGEYRAAEERFEQLLEIGGDPFYAYRQLAELAMEQNRNTEAEGYFRRCLELYPGDESIRLMLEELIKIKRSSVLK